jgi:hypothetical protein
MQAPGPQLPPDATGWLSGEVNGTSHSLKFLGQEQGWQRMPEQPATWTPPVPTDDQVPASLPCYRFAVLSAFCRRSTACVHASCPPMRCFRRCCTATRAVHMDCTRRP